MLEQTPSDSGNSFPRPRLAYLKAVLACLLTALLAALLRSYVDLANIVMLFLLTVFLCAVRLGRGPAVVSAFLSVGLFDFFFVPPHLSFAVADVQYLITFAVMLAVGLISAHLTAGMAEQAELARRRERETRALYEMARELGAALGTEQVAEITQRFLAQARRLHSALFFVDEAGQLVAGPAIGHPPGRIEFGFARAAFVQGEVLEMDTLAGSGMAAIYLPLRTPLQVRGVLAVSPLDVGEEALRAQRPLLNTVASLIAIAVERLHYVEIAQAHSLQIESEKLRNSILSALSHDLRTPLTAMVGLADSLVLSRAPLPPSARETAQTLADLARAMSRMLGNLLDMARLQAGRVSLRKEWQPLEEVVGSALRLLESALAHHRVEIRLAPDLPLVCFDAVLVERVLCNLLENAAKFAPAESAIELEATVAQGMLVVAVNDRGPGFPPGMEQKVFEMFARGMPESATPGVGLGLAICKSIVTVHGGCMQVELRPGGGARVSFTLPLGTPPAVEEETE
ncbi:DUF4118 domain-containing protein [Denitratisoma oestradiolicum]|uniref:histidine kinase n=1 Tax=Denitratisoma oestradiolicum TaxID=311182 RepID=A0A6S6XTA9_9PROT|nr:DUF4118 domain-containing protein [Denitratisoma oestradiolicum]TWO79368.1 hypothetical protein CBW56_15195 [Denitratisoma oestradiolicum]CAB1367980.1 Histidine kinase [Denitratisoma oestradiolicum]